MPSSVQAVGDQLGPGGEVDAVETRPLHRRRRDAHVHLERARPRAASAPCARWVLPRTIESSTTTIRLPRTTSRSGLSLSRMPSWRMVCDGWMKVRPDVRVLHQAGAVRDAGLPRRSRSRPGCPTPGTGITRSASTGCSLASRAADLDPGRVDVAAGDRGVRAGQVDVLEEAALGLRRGEPGGPQPVLVDGDQLARLDLADEAGADDVQRGGLAGHHPAALHPAQHQRADALGVAGRVQRVLVHEDEAERAAQRRQHLQRRGLDRQVGAAGQQRGDQRGVGGGARSASRPRSATSRASSAVLTRLPLWASAMVVPAVVARIVGWAFSQVEPPVVE